MIPGAFRDRMAGLVEQVRGPTWRRSILALLDQGVVSGTSFMASVLIGRLAGDQALGIYALGLSVTLLLGAVQDSLITVPYTFFCRRRPAEERRSYAGATLVHNGLMALGVALLVFASGWGARALGGPAWLPPVLWALGLTVPLYLVRDFARRFAFAHYETAGALAIDATAAALHLGALAWLGWTGRLNGVLALLVLGLAYGVPAGAWLLRERARFGVRDARPAEVFGRHWRFGRIDVSAQVIGVVQGYVVHWLLALLRVPDATGVLAACMTISTLSNPLILGVNNIFMPRVADAWEEGGALEVWRVVRKTTRLFAIGMAPITLFLILFGGRLVEIVYGAGYGGQGHAVGVLAVVALIAAGDITCGNGLRALDRPEVYVVSGTVGLIVVSGAVGVLVSLAAGAPLTAEYGVLGAAYAILAGSLADSLVQWSGFIRLIRRARESETGSESTKA